jgi:hypothetical protein
MINPTNEASRLSESTSLTGEKSIEKKISTDNPTDWVGKIGRIYLNHQMPIILSAFAIGFGCLIQKAPALKILGGSVLLSMLMMSLSKVFHRTISREEQLQSNIAKLIDKFPDLETIEKDSDSFKNRVENFIKEVISKLQKNIENQTNLEILKNQCQDVLQWTLQTSKDDNDSNDRIERKNDANIKLFNILNNFHNNMIEVCNTIENDKDEISSKFFSSKNLELTSIELTSGESHNKGKRPCFVSFKGGEKILYKPRNVCIDACITGNQSDSLFQLINSMDINIDLQTYTFLPKNGYGYVEFLSSSNIMNSNEMKNYYYTLGMLQAISTIFGIHDLHEENVLIHNKKPCLIDLEVSFNLNELINHKGNTGLTDKIINCSDNINNGEIIKNEIKSGFDKIKSIFEDDKNKKNLKKFIEDLDPNLAFRFVPINTQDLIPWSVNKLIKEADMFATYLKDEQNNKIGEYDIEKTEITSEQTKQDIINADVPFIKANLKGDVSYNGVTYLKSKYDIKKLIKDSIDNSTDLKSDNFLNSIKIKNIK